MICNKCGLILKSEKKLLGKKHVSGGSPEHMIHEETFSTRCPGAEMSPVLTQYYYSSEEHHSAAKAGDPGAIEAARQRAEQERNRYHQRNDKNG